jgi:hypothetical protein
LNLEVTAITAAPAPAFDLRDWFTLGLVAGGFVASWVYVFLHPSVEAFGICVGAVGTFSSVFHWLCVHDDKSPDRKSDS